MGDLKKEINYLIRPAKHVERRMLAEALHQLSHFEKLRSYQYVGFGAKYFVDFALFHRSLGIEKMISIEQDIQAIKRYEWNKPYKCIEVKGGTSTEVLPTLDWSRPSIVWLDYDGRFDDDCKADINFVASSAVSGSVLLVTANAEIKVTADDQITAARKQLDLDESTPVAAFKAWGYASLLKQTIASRIHATLASRNAALPVSERLHYEQLFYFVYKDSVRMLTVGGLLLDELSRSAYKKNRALFDMPFVAKGDRPFEIAIPQLTPREIRYLDSYLPQAGAGQLANEVPIPKVHQKRYRRLYRYYPNFADASF